MVIKSDDLTTHLVGLREVLFQLKRYNMRLNLEKCVFRVGGRNFLGFMLTHRGIHANSDKCQTILEMRSPRNVKEAQRLAERITSLSRFLPRIVKKARLIMNLLIKAKIFVWDEDCKEVFRKLKETLATPPILSKLDTTKKLIVYLSIMVKAISLVLVQEEGIG